MNYRKYYVKRSKMWDFAAALDITICVSRLVVAVSISLHAYKFIHYKINKIWWIITLMTYFIYRYLFAKSMQE